jgi:hypothetical protein
MNKKASSISGITKATMSKILTYEFGDDFQQIFFSLRPREFRAIMSEDFDKERWEKFTSFWKNQGVIIAFAEIKDRKINS